MWVTAVGFSFPHQVWTLGDIDNSWEERKCIWRCYIMWYHHGSFLRFAMEYRTAFRQKPALVVKMKNPATKKVPRSFFFFSKPVPESLYQTSSFGNQNMLGHFPPKVCSCAIWGICGQLHVNLHVFRSPPILYCIMYQMVLQINIWYYMVLHGIV